MKRFFESIFNFLIDVGRARAAADLARAGYYKEARQLMEQKN